MTITSNIKNLIKKNDTFKSFLSWGYRLVKCNSVKCKGHGNRVKTNITGLFLSHSKIRVNGSNNEILFIEGGVSSFDRLHININGNNNRVIILPWSSGSGLSINIEDDNNLVELGEYFSCGPNTEFAAIEGTSIIFGKDCMLSANITVRTGDSHSVIDLNGNRINYSKSIYIGDHVWIGNTVLIFKGSEIGKHSIIAGGSVVTGKVFPSHSIVGGNPAKVIKEGVDWNRQRI